MTTEMTAVQEAIDMTAPRNLTVELTSEDIKFFRTLTAGHGDDPIFRVLGYFVTWGLGDYPEAKIWRSRDEIMAFYTGPNGRRFVMAAVWRPELGVFSTHS